MKYRKLLIGSVAIAGTYVIARVAAKIKTEDEHINDDNPYLGQTVKLSEAFLDKATEIRCPFYKTIMKPVLDHVLSFCGLIIFSPLYVLISLAVYIDDPGSIFFAQKRIGKDKRYFMCHKFRSMKMSAPHDVPTHELENPEQYITKVGRVLRKTSLDELPQIWDIFRGRMSVIGPRPALWNQEDLIAEREKYRANDIKPGLTGWAQINGRDELQIVDKAKLDGIYMKRIGLGMDLKCFFGTIVSVFRADGVVEGGAGKMKKKKQEK